MKKVFLYSLGRSLPIVISFVPVALAYGILMSAAGYNWVWTGACSAFVLAGSLQYLMVSFFSGGVSLFTVAAMALLLNSRHIFYGIPFVEEWRNYGPRRLFLIYSLADESFALHCSNEFDDGDPSHRMWSRLFDGMLVAGSWIVLSILSGLIGSLIRINTDGVDFAMTALFIVILIDQLQNSGYSRLPVILAAISSAACLLILGPSAFILPSLVVTVLLLLIFRDRIEPEKQGGAI